MGHSEDGRIRAKDIEVTEDGDGVVATVDASAPADRDGITVREFCGEWINHREEELETIWRDIENPDRSEVAARGRLEGELRAYERVLSVLDEKAGGEEP